MLEELRIALVDFYQSPRCGAPDKLTPSQQSRLVERFHIQSLRRISFAQWCAILAIGDISSSPLFLRTRGHSKRTGSGSMRSWWPELVQVAFTVGPYHFDRWTDASHRQSDELARAALTG